MENVTVEIKEGMKFQRIIGGKEKYQLITSSVSGKQYLYCPYVDNGVLLAEDELNDSWECCNTEAFEDIVNCYKVKRDLIAGGTNWEVMDSIHFMTHIDDELKCIEAEEVATFNVSRVKMRRDDLATHMFSVKQLRNKIEGYYNSIQEAKLELQKKEESPAP